MKNLFAAVPFLLAAPLLAQSGPVQAPGAPDPARVTAGTYTVEGRHTQILFSYDHFGFNNNFGIASGATGSLSLDPKAPNGAKLVVDVPVNTIHTSIAPLDTELQSPKFFDSAKFPTAHFESTRIVTNGTTADISGNLTIKGVTKPVVFSAKFGSAGINPYSKKETITFVGSATIKRSDFGLSFLVPLVGDDVSLKIAAVFEKAA